MRAVERHEWARRRSSRHDEMCLAVRSHPERLFPGFIGAVRAHCEAPLGSGFVDVLAVTEAPGDEAEVAIVEVKTRHERASGGDILRQLGWYAARLLEQRAGVKSRRVLVVEDVDGIDSAALELVLGEGVEVLPVSWFTA